MNECVETVKSWCIEQTGCPYIYGATGQACTPAYRRARIEQYPQYENNITRNCQILSNRATSCAGCKWARDGVGRLAYDCAQLTRFSMKQAGIALVSGANSQWQKTAFVLKGELDDMPRGLLCLIYRDDEGKKGHTGVYTGDGYVVHAKGHDYGVVREKMGESRFTHFGIPAGLYSDAELKAAGIDPSGNLPTLRRGSKGELVKQLQRYLNKWDERNDLTVDGVFGEKTEEAVKAYQRDNGLTADGVVGPKTWAELGVVPEPPEEPEAPDEEEETVRVPKRMLEVWAETLEDLALDVRGFAGGD